jgi:hypothetical protein
MTSSRHYDVLGVGRSADAASIHAAYRQLAKLHHPDVAKGTKEEAAERFRKIQEAYEVLSGAQRRAKYDAQPDATEPPASEAGPFPWPPREPPWNPQPQTATSPPSRRRYVVRSAVAALAVLDILAIKSSPDLSVPLVTFRRKIRTACSGARIGRNAEICKVARIWVDGGCRR